MARYTHLLVSLLLIARTAPSAVSVQNDATVRVTVGRFATVHTEPLNVAAGHEIVVELSGDAVGTPLVSVYVYGEDGSLVARDNPESTTPTFTWLPPEPGKYSVVLDNTGDGQTGVTIRTRSVRGGGRAGFAQYATVRVNYATNRQAVGTNTAPSYGVDPDAVISYGYADVSIPRDHRLGELEGPSVLRLEFREDPNKHIVVLTTFREDQQRFAERVSSQLAASHRKEALLIIHGFNVSFDDALRRAAQLSYDLAFDGPVVTFCWPSAGSLVPLAYTRDQRNADLSAAALLQFVRVLGRSGVTRINIIAHSMGSRVLTSALQQLAIDSRDKPATVFQEMAFVAPDVDSELFKAAAKQIASSARRVTLYASSRDEALAASDRVFGYPRAGQAGPDLVVVPGIQTIDASVVDTSLLGLHHSYFADNDTVLSDLFGLLRGRAPEDRFGLVVATSPTGPYWRFRPAKH